ncbi:MAG: transposase, partial [Candidatus Hydrogenedentes bacterium]|nr:transposase [Candidatus Hydrogenedentota bacterium]
MDAREQKGLEIAARLPLHKYSDRWMVPSQSGGGIYTVHVNGDAADCTCADFQTRQLPCKHIHAIRFVEERERGPIQVPLTSQRQDRPTYPQDWKAYHRAQRNEKHEFMRLLYDLCQTIPQPEYEFGRPRLALAGTVFGAALKVYSTLSGRRAMGDLDIAQEKGYLAQVPHYSTLYRYMDSDDLTPVLHNLIGVASAPLRLVESQFAADSSGFSTSRFDRWYDEKYGRERSQRLWVKAHIMVGTKTTIITAVTVTDRDANDYPHLPGLVDATVQRFAVKQVSADKAYLGESNLAAIAKAGAEAFIPLKVNSTPGGSELWTRLYGYFMYNRADFLDYYHRRSNVETTFSMVKAKFGDSVRSKTDAGQRNEVLLKVLCHNVCVLIQ